MIALVAITDREAAPEEPQLRSVPVGRLAALCAPEEPEAPTLDVIVSRQELLDRLMDACDLLPVRYGTTLADEAAVAHVLAGRHDELAAALERVRGAVELGLRVEHVAPAPEETETGREYLRAHAIDARRAQDIHATLATRARAATTRYASELLRAAYLVDRGDVDVFAADVRAAQQANTDLAFLCTGPWPPFSFTSTVPPV